MARPATGTIVERPGKGGTTYALRFRAYGKREFVTLGSMADGWSRPKAELELANILADVRRGMWTVPRPEPAPARDPHPTFHVFASTWFASREGADLQPKTIEYLRWALSDHLLPRLKDVPVDEFTAEVVDQYRDAKAREAKARHAELDDWLARRARLVKGEAIEPRPPAPLSNSSINKTIDVLSEVLEVAVEYGILGRNPAKGKRRRLPVSRKPRTFLEKAVHIIALLDGAGELDARALVRKGQRRALLATLTLAGLRIGEALDLRWTDVDLDDAKLRVRDSKTAAGIRTVDLVVALVDELRAYKRETPGIGNALVFGTTTGGRQSETNVRRRILAPAIANANDALARMEVEPLPEKITPHSLRRTFASILAALGEPMPSVIRQLGHTDPSLTLRIYAHDVARGDAERERLRALVEGRQWAPMGTTGDRGRPSPSAAVGA